MLRGVVHDEIVLDVPIEDADEVEREVIKAMTFEWAPPKMPNAKPIKVIADVSKRGATWGACYEK
jgi:DNA polymerase I-like protein with 3'-5' exonuclease and polymerase domains